MIEDDPIRQTTFGEFLRFLRRRARMTQRQLGVALDYSVAMVARLESGERTPEVALVKTTYIEALGLKHAPDLAARLIELAATTRAEARLTPAPILPPAHRTKTLSNLPIQLTRFIGRERETTEVACLLNMSRLVTLTGSGGVGKTRLALEVGSSFVESRTVCVPVLPTSAPNERPHGIIPPAPPFPDGIWLAELAPFADPALIPQTAAAALHVPEQPGHPHLETLIAYLNDKHLLLILDNCEHLVDACAQLVESLLRSCPHVRILATSRESLRVAGEVVWRVPSMATPDPAYLPPLPQVLDYDAIALFIQTATAVEPGFNLTPDDMNAIARICWRLDGIPLAIEMAAGQVAALPVGDIAAVLDDRFSLLESGKRTALPRQQTLHAALDWSYDLLDEQERILLARLAVFDGGWTIDAAKAVCGEATDSVLTALDVLPALLRLVHKSLVVSMTQDGRARYRFLETVRQYAKEHLQERGEWKRVGACHLCYYLALAEEAEPALFKLEGTEWLMRLDGEHDNFRAAIDWAFATGETTAGLRLVESLETFWAKRGYMRERREQLLKALARSNPQERTLIRAKVLNKAAYILWFYNKNYDEAHSMLEEALSIGMELGDQENIAHTFLYLQYLAISRKDFTTARVFNEKALTLWRVLGNLSMVAYTLGQGAEIARYRGEFDHSQRAYEEAIALFTALDEKVWRTNAVRRLGRVALLQGDYTKAATLCVQGLKLSLESGHKHHTASGLATLAGLAVAQRQSIRAAQLFGAVAALLHELDAPLLFGDVFDYEDDLSALRTQLDEASFDAAWAEGQQMTLRQAVAYALQEDGADASLGRQRPERLPQP